MRAFMTPGGTVTLGPLELCYVAKFLLRETPRLPCLIELLR